MTARILRITPLYVWQILLQAASNWVNPSDRHERHYAHRWLGREIKRRVLATGGYQVASNVPTGHHRGAWPMTSAAYEIEETALAEFLPAIAQLAEHIAGKHRSQVGQQTLTFERVKYDKVQHETQQTPASGDTNSRKR